MISDEQLGFYMVSSTPIEARKEMATVTLVEILTPQLQSSDSSSLFTLQRTTKADPPTLLAFAELAGHPSNVRDRWLPLCHSRPQAEPSIKGCH